MLFLSKFLFVFSGYIIFCVIKRILNHKDFNCKNNKFKISSIKIQKKTAGAVFYENIYMLN